MTGLSVLFRRCVNLVTAAVIAICAGLVVLRVFGLSPYIIVSGSMEPALPTGSIAFIDTWNRAGNEGDIVAFRTGRGMQGVIVTHRIVKEHWDGLLTTKGDANAQADAGVISRDDIIGTCLFRIPRAGRLAAQLCGPRGGLVILWIAGLNALAGAADQKRGPAAWGTRDPGAADHI